MRPVRYIVCGTADQAEWWRKQHGVRARDLVRIWKRPDPAMRGLHAQGRDFEVVWLTPSPKEDVIRRHLEIIQSSGARVTEHECERCPDVRPG